MSGGLEHRYRRLLSWYPVEHRRRYEEEMVAVLLAGAREGQRRPGWSATANLLRSAVSTRWRYLRGRARDGRWSDAAAALGTLLPMLLFAQHARAVLRNAAWLAWTPMAADPREFTASFPVSDWLPALAWLVVTLAGLRAWRRVTPVAAWAAACTEAVALVLRYRDDPVVSPTTLFLLALAVSVAVVASVPAAVRRGAAVVRAAGRRRFAAGCALVTVSSTVNLVLVANGLAHFNLSPVLPGRALAATGSTSVLFYVVAAALAVGATGWMSAPARRRLVALLVPAVTVLAVAVLASAALPAIDLVGGLVVAVVVVGGGWRVFHLVELGLVEERETAGPPPVTGGDGAGGGGVPA